VPHMLHVPCLKENNTTGLTPLVAMLPVSAMGLGGVGGAEFDFWGRPWKNSQWSSGCIVPKAILMMELGDAG
jgi:hypothetical protein